MFALRELATSGTEPFCTEMLLVMEETQALHCTSKGGLWSELLTG